MTHRIYAALFAVTTIAGPLSADSPPPHAAASSNNFAAPVAASSAIAQFVPRPSGVQHRIDYQHWDEALGWFVVPMGPSIRQGAPSVDPGTGSRRIYGHKSRYRLEGNRVAFSFFAPEILEGLTSNLRDMERVGSELDLTAIPRNEQLAFWINLHNFALVEALGRQYPVTGLDARLALHDRKLVTVKGVALSPRDIRERIVYPNWRNPKVIYGFWYGVIGGPSIQRLAYSGSNVDALLALSAEEFVNSLRGVERYGGALQLSSLYRDMAGAYFPDSATLLAHLHQYSRDDVRDLLQSSDRISYKSLETDIADLVGGRPDPGIQVLATPDCAAFTCLVGVANTRHVGTRPNRAIQRLMRERAEKLERADRSGIRTGMVIYGDGAYSETGAPPEVD